MISPREELRNAMREADALLFVTPEYNHGIPGVLKNAIDWASRSPATTPLDGKAASILGAATGMVGTARAQLALRQAFVFTKTYPLQAPEISSRGHRRSSMSTDGSRTRRRGRWCVLISVCCATGRPGFVARRRRPTRPPERDFYHKTAKSRGTAGVAAAAVVRNASRCSRVHYAGILASKYRKQHRARAHRGIATG